MTGVDKDGGQRCRRKWLVAAAGQKGRQSALEEMAGRLELVQEEMGGWSELVQTKWHMTGVGGNVW